jgi:type IV pilus assembly protein PilM
LPQDAIVEGAIKEMEIVSSAIKTLYKQLKVKNKNVVTSISGYSVIVKKISMQKRGEAELEATIQDEAEQYIPFDIHDVNLDYEILSSDADKGGKRSQRRHPALWTSCLWLPRKTLLRTM